ncbi:RVT_3 domain-containing protein, partial [Cephalotus follicularis]
GILRDEQGHWICCFTRRIGSCSSLEAELWGLCDGLHIAIQKGVFKLCICFDAQATIDLINYTHDLSSHNFYGLFCDYRCLMTQLQERHLSHVFREANQRRILWLN